MAKSIYIIEKIRKFQVKLLYFPLTKELQGRMNFENKGGHFKNEIVFSFAIKSSEYVA